MRSPMTVSARASGRCLCGAVRSELRGPCDVVLCPCIECRRWSGHGLAATAVRREGLVPLESGGLRWIESRVRVLAHVYVSHAGDYYDLPEDGLPRHQRLSAT